MLFLEEGNENPAQNPLSPSVLTQMIEKRENYIIIEIFIRINKTILSFEVKNFVFLR